MPRKLENLNVLTLRDKKKVEELEKKCDRVLDKLFENPSDEKLYLELRLLEVDIVRITGEMTTEY